MMAGQRQVKERTVNVLKIISVSESFLKVEHEPVGNRKDQEKRDTDTNFGILLSLGSENHVLPEVVSRLFGSLQRNRFACD
jgi:hypothetical protein